VRFIDEAAHHRFDGTWRPSVVCFTTETFVDNVDRLAFDNWEEHEALYRESRPIVEMPYPRPESHCQVPKAIRKRLEARGAK
jgi:hypothetical protein